MAAPVPLLVLVDCEVDLDRLAVNRPGRGALRLSPGEGRLLGVLAAAPGRTFGREDLALAARASTPRAVDTVVRRIRSKIERDPSRPDHVVTSFGEGYRFEPVGAASSAPAPSVLGPVPAERWLAIGDAVRVDLERRAVAHPAGPRTLTRLEVALLEHLAARPGRAVAMEDLLRDVWHLRGRTRSRAVVTALSELRRKVELDPRRPVHLRTLRGQGYLFDPAGVDPGPPIAPDPDRKGPRALVGVRWADEGMAAARVSHDATLRRLLADFGGEPAFMGHDQGLVWFERVDRAVAWCRAARDALAADPIGAGTAFVVDWDAPLVRTDPGSGHQLWLGPCISRMMALLRELRGSWVLATHAAATALADRAVDLGEQRVPGLPEPVRLYDPIGSGTSLAAVRPGNLAHQGPLPSICGREALLEDLVHRVGEGCVAVLTGPPGGGKTLVARALAERWSQDPAVDGVWWCEGRGASDVAGLAALVAAALDPRATDGSGLAGALARTRSAVVVLDGVDRVAAGDPGLAAALGGWRAVAGRARWVVTSQVELPAAGAGWTRWTVGPLPEDAAAELFVARAREAAPGWTPPADLTPLRALQGLPLALEVVAARMDLHALRDATERLEVGGSRLDAALRWSRSLLSPGDRRALGCLAVFRGGFDAEAAAAVIGEGGGYESLRTLARHSLIHSVPVGPGRAPRFDLLDAVRRFAGPPDPDAVGRHVEVFAARARAAPPFGEPFPAEARERLTGDLDNLAAASARALERGELEPAARIAHALGLVAGGVGAGARRALAACRSVGAAVEGPWAARLLAHELYVAMHLAREPYLEQAREAERRAAAMVDGLDGWPDEQIRLLLWSSWCRAALASDPRGALARLDRAAEIATERVPRLVAAVELQRSDLLRRAGRTRDALASARRGLAHVDEAQRDLEAQLRSLLALVHYEEGRWDTAVAVLAPIERQLGELGGAARSGVLFAALRVHPTVWDHELAVALAVTHLPAIAAGGHAMFAAERSIELAQVHRERGELDQAAAALNRATALLGPTAIGLALLALVRADQGRVGEALALLDEAEALEPDDPEDPFRPWVRAEVQLAAGDVDGAGLAAEEGMSRAANGPERTAMGCVVARVAVRQGEPERAERVLSAVLAGVSRPYDALVARCLLASPDARLEAERRLEALPAPADSPLGRALGLP